MVAVNAAVVVGVLLYKIPRPPYVPYIHLLVDYHFGFIKRALIGAVVGLFTSKVPVWLVFVLGGATWLVTLALFVNENEIRDPDVSEVHTERIYPKAVGALRIANRDMAGDAFLKPESSEQPEGSGQPFLAMAPLLLDIRELRRTGQILGSSKSFRHK